MYLREALVELVLRGEAQRQRTVTVPQPSRLVSTTPRPGSMTPTTR